MPTIYLTRDGDVLDAICVKHYGYAGLNQSLAATLEANRGLADKGSVYRAGEQIILPDWTPKAEKSDVQLWD